MTNNEDALKAFLINVRRLRKENKLSKKKMAELLNISVYTLNKIERGVFPPRLTIEPIFLIYDVFGVRPAEQFVSNSKFYE